MDRLAKAIEEGDASIYEPIIIDENIFKGDFYEAEQEVDMHAFVPKMKIIIFR